MSKEVIEMLKELEDRLCFEASKMPLSLDEIEIFIHNLQSAISTLQLFEQVGEAMPGKKVINPANKIPKPDILNDCEVRREGFNDCHDLLTAYLAGRINEQKLRVVLEQIALDTTKEYGKERVSPLALVLFIDNLIKSQALTDYLLGKEKE